MEDTKKFLSGRSREVQERLVELMENESLKMNYENAAKYRDRIKALNHIQAKQTVSIANLNDADALGIYVDKGYCCIQVFFFRNGCNLGNKAFFIKNTEEQNPATIFEAFIPQLYNDSNPPPAEIIISSEIENAEIMEEALSQIAGHKVKITSPQKGEKKQLIENAVQNAVNSLKQQQIGRLKQTQILEKIAQLFGLTQIPQRIEVYDNSHIMGQYQVGAMIVSGTDGFDKKSYRRFNIKNENTKPGDDYAMLREVLTRRLKRLEKKAWPDLILIDGGAGHLSTAEAIFSEFDTAKNIVFACISKGPDRNAGREQFHMPGKEPFTLPHSDPVLHHLQVLRDEAHRFAIGSHRKKRAKSVTKSALDTIAGIGTKRKKMLINHFGSVEGIKQAGIEELVKLEGISKSIARKIIEALQ